MIGGALLALMLFFVSLPSGASARDPWTKTDTAYQLTWTALKVLDWSQTRRIAREPDRFHECNPILGATPSVKRVDVYNAATLAGNWAIAYALPKPYRRWFQVVSIGASAYCVTINFKIGLGGGDWVR